MFQGTQRIAIILNIEVVLLQLDCGAAVFLFQLAYFDPTQNSREIFLYFR